MAKKAGEADVMAQPGFANTLWLRAEGFGQGEMLEHTCWSGKLL